MSVPQSMGGLYGQTAGQVASIGTQGSCTQQPWLSTCPEQGFSSGPQNIGGLHGQTNGQVASIGMHVSTLGHPKKMSNCPGQGFMSSPQSGGENIGTQTWGQVPSICMQVSGIMQP